MIKAGTYKATVLSHAISETKAGNPQAVISFSFESEGKSHSLKWYGSFSEKAQPITIKSLIACGLKGNNPAGELEIGKEVSIVVEIEEDEQGKDRNKVRWVNSLNEIKNIVPQAQAMSKLASLEGAVMLARSKTNTPDNDEIPF